MKTNELKCTDLRIGNLIDYFGYIVKVDTLEFFDGKERVGGINTTEGDRVFDKPSYFEPIELTEEVLLKIGFKKEKKITSNLYYLDFEENEDDITRVKYVIYNSNSLPLLKIITTKYNSFEGFELTKRGIKYLHQLQNAYYCLTGQELNIEL
jgi:hypothetical protein